MGEDLPDRARLGDERDQPDVATAVGALERKLLPHPDSITLDAEATTLAWTPAGSLLAVGDRSGTVAVHRVG